MFVLKKTTSNLSSPNLTFDVSGMQCFSSFLSFRQFRARYEVIETLNNNDHFERVEKNIPHVVDSFTCFLTLRSIHKIPFQYLLRIFYVRYSTSLSVYVRSIPGASDFSSYVRFNTLGNVKFPLSSFLSRYCTIQLQRNNVCDYRLCADIDIERVGGFIRIDIV